MDCSVLKIQLLNIHVYEIMSCLLGLKFLLSPASHGLLSCVYQEVKKKKSSNMGLQTRLSPPVFNYLTDPSVCSRCTNRKNKNNKNTPKERESNYFTNNHLPGSTETYNQIKNRKSGVKNTAMFRGGKRKKKYSMKAAKPVTGQRMWFWPAGRVIGGRCLLLADQEKETASSSFLLFQLLTAPFEVEWRRDLIGNLDFLFRNSI